MVKRPQEITAEYLQIIEAHLQDIISGKTDQYLEIHQVANAMHIHPTHLSNTIKETTGKSPCDICNEKTIEAAKELLAKPENTIVSVANKLTFEASHFTKYFKKFAGMTPTQFKNAQLVEA